MATSDSQPSSAWPWRPRGNSLPNSLSRLLLLVLLARLVPAQDVEATIDPALVVRATCALYVEQILGWEYNATSSQQWKRGVEETSPVGSLRRSSPEFPVRAIALGEEGDNVVFMTLRTYIDPLYPNPNIQGVIRAIKDQNAKPIDFSPPGPARKEWIRYGRLQFSWYGDRGGGVFEVLRKVVGMTECDPGRPKYYEKFWPGFAPNPEVYDGATYDRPHELVSVPIHFEYQKLFQVPIQVQTFGLNDVALLYVPKQLFVDSKQTLPPTIGLRNPTATVNCLLYRSKDLFGFQFVLVGLDSMRAIKAYRPTIDEVLPGVGRLGGWVDLVFGTDTLSLLLRLDRAIETQAPDVAMLKTVAERMGEVLNMSPATLRSIAQVLWTFMPKP